MECKTENKIYRRKLRRRREGLASKCYVYSKLEGVELALFIRYPKRGDFYSYTSSTDLPWLHDIQGMMKLPKAKNEGPTDLKKRVKDEMRGTKYQPPQELLTYLESDGWLLRYQSQNKDAWVWTLDGTKTSSRGTILSIYIHYGKNSALLDFLETAPTTAALNLISWNKGYALYPRSTLLRHPAKLNNENCRPSELFNERLAILDRYGIPTTNHDLPPDEDLNSIYSRRVGDGRTFSIEFDTSGIHFPDEQPVTDDVLSATTFDFHVLRYPYKSRKRPSLWRDRYFIRLFS